MKSPNILIAGIGNIFLGDDGFGCEVLRRLGDRHWPKNLTLIDFGIRGLDLVYALLDNYELNILVDAVPRGEAPGTIYTIEPNLEELSADNGQPASMDGHSMNPVAVLRMVKSLDGRPGKVLLVGCEPETLGPEEGQMGLSKTVEASVETAVKVIEDLVNEFLVNEKKEVFSVTGGNLYATRKSV